MTVTVELQEQDVEVLRLAYEYSAACRQDRPPYKGLMDVMDKNHQRLLLRDELMAAIERLTGESDGSATKGAL